MKILKQEVKPQWMVLARHFGMPGGVLDYGSADIKEFFDTFDKADRYARNLFIETETDLVDPRVWVLLCEKTYVRAKEGLASLVSEVKVD
jgi:hypothetical protein